ncbi:predicted protein [Pyrenophora tritici-repentis Pt-1C-BFP]|uniref:DUF7730 domain-containing protein n=1 Tax=Pyrenophora tritici-repentis (strain Pt-1C-BFP) TaxID=426418 RepID=B2WCB4_PYRTR|nr:uncharacterized protein PTRG_07623 [Pyrenophora tritici-repentis Pt-1C-BFP]EDU50542.1 predicted protein [Pyrenophora tritici-repentis Pt-1C-BFP]
MPPQSDSRMSKRQSSKRQSSKPKLSKEEVEEIMRLNQKNSPFLRLPSEIRNKIYALVLGGKTIHWRLGSPNEKPSYSKHRYLEIWGPEYLGKKKLSCYDHSQRQVIRLSSLASLPAVCRQIRTEAYFLPFTLNDFEVYPADVIDFIDGEIWHTAQDILSRNHYIKEHVWVGSTAMMWFQGLKRVIIPKWSKCERTMRPDEARDKKKFIMELFRNFAQNKDIEFVFEQ